MVRFRLSLVFLLLLSPLVSNCGNARPLGVDEIYVSTVIFGRITADGGTPLAAVVISSAIGPRFGCAAAGPDDRNKAVTTDGNGFYRIVVGTMTLPFTGCAKILATPPPQAQVSPDSATVPSVYFGGTDSTRVDLTLRPAA